MATFERNDTALLHKTRPYAQEFIWLSYWSVLSTFSLLIVLTLLSLILTNFWLKIILAVPIGLLVMRSFILFHDFQHKAILSRSVWARYFFGLFGYLVFTPANVWRQSHNFHHAHNTVLETSHIGSFWTVSVAQWEAMTPAEQLRYRLFRHPSVILFGLLTVFIYDHCIHSFIRNPSKNWTALAAVLLHIAIAFVASFNGLFWDYILAWLLPLAIAGCFGSYLFYAQHNFPDIKLLNRQDWSYTSAALEASCFIEMSKIIHWFSGNIAYHHVHHLNHRIPFYRLPETMQAIEELHSPKKTSLYWRDIISCLRLRLWDEQEERMVSIKELKSVNLSGAVKASR